jgi:hypothetical protein
MLDSQLMWDSERDKGMSKIWRKVVEKIPEIYDDVCEFAQENRKNMNKGAENHRLMKKRATRFATEDLMTYPFKNYLLENHSMVTWGSCVGSEEGEIVDFRKTDERILGDAGFKVFSIKIKPKMMRAILLGVLQCLSEDINLFQETELN